MIHQTTLGGAVAVVPDDDVDQTYNALYVGEVGDVAVITESGESVIFVAVPAGSILPIRVKRVLATGTDADSIVGLS